MNRAGLKAIAEKLTYNVLVSLENAHKYPNPNFPNSVNGKLGVRVGRGKWTHLGLIGVFNSLRKHGLVEAETDLMTPLGIEMAAYLASSEDEGFWGKALVLDIRLSEKRRSGL